MVVRKPFVEYESWLIYRAGGQKGGSETEKGVWKGCYKERGVNRRNANIK
jgi:hypothetical protein